MGVNIALECKWIVNIILVSTVPSYVMVCIIGKPENTSTVLRGNRPTR